MAGADVLFLAADILADEAARISSQQEALIKLGATARWEEGRACAHHAIHAGALILDRFRKDGDIAKSANRRPPAEVMAAVEIVRSTFIAEMMRSEKPKGGDGDAAS